MIRSIAIRAVLLACTFAFAGLTHAEGDAEAGKALFILCSACHGQSAEGVAALNAPANAGQDEWYVVRQLINYREGLRGTEAEDIYGGQMRPMAITLADEQAVKDIAAYIATLPTPEPAATVEGNLENGKREFETCAACHGASAEGSTLLNVPRLSKQHDWYLQRQIENFKKGLRGAHANDIYGTQMSTMAELLETEEQVRDVIAYIASLDYVAQPD